ncbi:MAG: ShlB/FhaC/HecB family hemolysin secretion/activation protein [Rhodocyclaceae bacterium]
MSAPLAPAQTQPEAAGAGQAVREVDVFEYIVRGNTVLDARSIERAVTPFLGPHKTLKDIEDARDALQAAYQSGGYQSVHVELPEQQVTEGVVFLQVSETRVGRVRVVDNKYTSPRDVREQVPSLKEGDVPNFTQAQAELTEINRSGKRQVVPLVREGTLPGTMDVDLKVDDNSPWHASLGLNNDKSADTDELRLSATVSHDNLWQLGHSASISFYGTPQDFTQSKTWSGAYIAPLPKSQWSLELSAMKSDSDVATVGGTTVLGKGQQFGLKGTYTVPDTTPWLHSFSVGVDFKDNKERTQLGQGGDEIPLQYAPITLDYSGFNQTERSQLQLGLQLVAGTRSFLGFGSSSDEFDAKRFKSSPSFMVLKGDTSGSLTFQNNSQLGFRLGGQLTDSPLISSEQFSIGGMSSVRGYLQAENTGDAGFSASIEMRTRPFAWSAVYLENARLYAFIDAGYVRTREPLAEQQDMTRLASVGVGTSFRLSSYVNGQIDLGYPLRNGARTERYEPRLNFNLNASY